MKDEAQKKQKRRERERVGLGGDGAVATAAARAHAAGEGEAFDPQVTTFFNPAESMRLPLGTTPRIDEEPQKERPDRGGVRKKYQVMFILPFNPCR